MTTSGTSSGGTCSIDEDSCATPRLAPARLRRLRNAARLRAGAPRREVTVGGRRVRTVDVHAHAAVPAVLDVVNGTPFERPARRQLEGNLGFPVAAARIADMDRDGIDVQVLSINAFWYGADRDLARRIYDVQAARARADVQGFPPAASWATRRSRCNFPRSPPSSSNTA